MNGSFRFSVFIHLQLSIVNYSLLLMPELNPYEAPQSNLLPDDGESLDNAWGPPWLGKALRVQFACVVVTLLASFVTVTPDVRSGWNAILFIAIGITGLLSLGILLAAIRYRIGWLVILELIVVGLPLMMAITMNMR
jgi:hypothetical protein